MATSVGNAAGLGAFIDDGAGGPPVRFVADRGPSGVLAQQSSAAAGANGGQTYSQTIDARAVPALRRSVYIRNRDTTNTLLVDGSDGTSMLGAYHLLPREGITVYATCTIYLAGLGATVAFDFIEEYD